MAATLGRRTALGIGLGATAGVVAGCGVETPQSSAPAADSPDLDLIRRAVKGEQSMLDLVTQLGTSDRGLRRRLRPVAAAASQHLEALQSAAPDLADAGDASSGSSASPDPSAQAVGRTATRLHRQRSADCVDASAGALAMLFASIAANHAVTAEQWRSG